MITAIPIILKRGTQRKGFCNIIAYSFLLGTKLQKKSLHLHKHFLLNNIKNYSYGKIYKRVQGICCKGKCR